jgi:hypothetical protein
MGKYEKVCQKAEKYALSMRKCGNCYFCSKYAIFCSTNDIFWCAVQIFWCAKTNFFEKATQTFDASLPPFGVSFCRLLMGVLLFFVASC